MAIHHLAGKPALRELLVNIPRLGSAYYTQKPDASDPDQKITFGTSGHRGSSFKNSFNEEHVLAGFEKDMSPLRQGNDWG